MHQCAIQIAVADVRDGPLSHSTLKEACSWGKVSMANEQTVYESGIGPGDSCRHARSFHALSSLRLPPPAISERYRPLELLLPVEKATPCR